MEPADGGGDRHRFNAEDGTLGAAFAFVDPSERGGLFLARLSDFRSSLVLLLGHCYNSDPWIQHKLIQGQRRHFVIARA